MKIYNVRSIRYGKDCIIISVGSEEATEINERHIDIIVDKTCPTAIVLDTNTEEIYVSIEH